MTPTEIARSLLGVPWVHQGRNPTVGLDCAGLLIVAYGESDEPDYGRDPQEGKLEAEITSRVGPPLEGCEDIRDGDIVAMAYAGDIRHCGMVALGDDGRLNLIRHCLLFAVISEPAGDSTCFEITPANWCAAWAYGPARLLP